MILFTLELKSKILKKIEKFLDFDQYMLYLCRMINFLNKLDLIMPLELWGIAIGLILGMAVVNGSPSP